jgi:glycosyltransferase involved in cell wall biosynthesis
MSESPLVSIIVPAFNAAQYIGDALRAVSAQTFTDHELIVINDGSPDTVELERELKQYPGKLVYIKQENRGAAAARNAGLRAASGEFVGFLDADDKWSPKFIESQISFLKRNHADLVYADALLTGESSVAGRTFMQLQPSRGEVTVANLLASEVTVLTSTVLARKQPIIEVGLFDEILRRGQDFDLWLRLVKGGARIVYHREVLAEHRIIESGLSGDTISQLQRTLTVLERVRAKGDLTAREEAALQHRVNVTMSKVALENGKEKLRERDFVGALGSFNEAQRYRQSWKVSLACLGLRIAPELFWRIYTRRAMPSGNYS